MQLNSIQAKLIFGLIFIAVLTLSVTYWNTNSEERELAESLVESNLWHTADNYFDSINAFMLTGMMSQRKILQDKMLTRKDIVEARVIRSEKTISMYGEGLPGQKVSDEYDAKALKGERLSFYSDLPNGERTFTVIEPLYARENYKGTNCLGCHLAKDGEILGAVRLTASLAEVDQRINSSVTHTLVIQFIVVTAAFGALMWFVHSIVIKRLMSIRDGLNIVAHDMDLTQSFESTSNDEVAELSNALNHTLNGFRTHLQDVSQSSNALLSVAQNLKSVAQQTESAVSDQKMQTDSVASALTEMEATSRDVQQRTQLAHEKSENTDALSVRGISVAEEAQSSIYALSEHIKDAATVIDQLDDRIQSVATVLDVIGGIAEQTNLLALNAAIEAARAGEQGRGFAVVADEVRSLAQRTHESTAQIKDTISGLQEEAKRAVESMNRSNKEASERAQSVSAVTETLRGIAEHVNEINELNTLIAQAAGQQNETTSEIQRNTIQIRDIAVQSESVAEQAMSNSEKLLAMAEELKRHVNSFKI